MTESIIKTEEEKKKGMLKEEIGKVTEGKPEELKGKLEQTQEEIKKKFGEAKEAI